MGIKDKFRKFIHDVDDDQDAEYEDEQGDYEEEKEEPYQAPVRSAVPQRTSSSSKFLSIPATTRLSVIVYKPTQYTDVAEIADHFKNKKTIVLNLDSTNNEVITKIIDFLGGVAYAADGDLKKIAATTYMLVPYDVEISGDLIEEIGSGSSDLF